MTVINPLDLADANRIDLDSIVVEGNEEMLNFLYYAESQDSFNDYADTLRSEYPSVYKRVFNTAALLGVSYYALSRLNATLGVSGEVVASVAPFNATVFPGYSAVRANELVSTALSYKNRGFEHDSISKLLSSGINESAYYGNSKTVGWNLERDDFGSYYRRSTSSNACQYCLERAIEKYYAFEPEDKIHNTCKCNVVLAFDNQGNLDLRKPQLIDFEDELTQ